jgi:hypothetical protein
MSTLQTINPESVNGYLYPGYYLPQDRAKQWTELDAQEKWDKQAVAKMITDNTCGIKKNQKYYRVHHEVLSPKFEQPQWHWSNDI